MQESYMKFVSFCNKTANLLKSAKNAKQHSAIMCDLTTLFETLNQFALFLIKNLDNIYLLMYNINAIFAECCRICAFRKFRPRFAKQNRRKK
jgi:hypothetical protein